MDPTCHTPTSHLPVLHVAVMAPRALPKLPAAVLAVVEADPGFPAVERRQVDHAPLPELATCLTLLCDLSSSSSPLSVRHERHLEQLALAAPIRELLSVDSKSTSPEPPSPP